MTITRRNIADDFDAIDEQIADANAHKRDMLISYRAQLEAAGMAKDEIKLEVEAVKAAIKRRRAVREKGAEPVEQKDALIDEIFAEISGSRAPRATRVEIIEEFPSHAKASTGNAVTAGKGSIPQNAGTGRSGEETRLGDGSGSVAPIQPETANETVGGFPVAAAPTNAEVTGGSDPDNSGAIGRRISEGPAKAGAEDAGVTGGESAASISKPRRPNCLHPDRCGGQGSLECYSFRSAAGLVHQAASA